MLSLGHQELTGVFPKSPDEQITTGPLELVWCPESGLLQLAHSYDPLEMYGENYGYRSGLNQSMVEHLSRKIQHLEQAVDLQPGDTVLDIGSNDCTSLRAYKTNGIKRIGIDPTGAKFRRFYPPEIGLVPDFFTAEVYKRATSERATVVTSIAMFYDLEDPVSFAREVEQILAPDGVWHLEQSYMPSMLRLCSYDTICHEHLEYYSLSSIARIMRAAGLKIIDVEMNAINGGSFALTVAKEASSRVPNDAVVNWLFEQEERMGLQLPGRTETSRSVCIATEKI